MIVSSWSVADWWWDGCLGASCLYPLRLSEEQWFLTATCSVQSSSLPRECSVHKTWKQFCLASYSGDCSQPTARNLQSNIETQTPRARREHQQNFGLNSNHAFWSLQSRQLESKIFSKMRFFRRTDSPRAKRRVHYGFWESPMAGFGEYTSCPERLSKKIVDSCSASLAQIASLRFEESILVFMGVRVCCSK